ncbi:hypothetical protein [Paenibacillus chitinolyticus]|uniref:hypothetical protein n=1 Tax=Paenibacillus chitinolyticus TaxID=79263 RepID=UPI0036464FDB
MSLRQIAEECSRAAKQQVSYGAVTRYVEAQQNTISPAEQKKAAVVKVNSRVERLANFDLDIIELQYQTTAALMDRFQTVDELPDIVDNRIDALAHELKRSGQDPDYISRWGVAFVQELRRNIQSIATLNRELRENSKFMADLREKAFEFNLIQEYLYLFMDVFKKTCLEMYESDEAHERAMQLIAANPRMQRIVEQQQKMRGEAG